MGECVVRIMTGLVGLALAVGVAGCSQKGLRDLRINSNGPDEFLILPTKQLFVDEACSGIVSVISLSTCAAIYAVWQRRPLVHIALLMAAAVGWAVLLNVVRIVTIALAEAHAGVDLAEGVAHTLLGLGVVALNVLAVIALDWLLHALLWRRPSLLAAAK